MVSCKICNNDNITSIYNGILRTGSFGKTTQKEYSVYFCENCKIKFIKDILPDDYYDSPTYREDYNNSIDAKEFFHEYDINDTNKISKIGLNNLRDQVVADFGTAAGTFLQGTSNISKYTIAIEPSAHFHEILTKYNKHVFSYGKDLEESGMKTDIATSFDVIEHVSSPVTYLQEMYNCLSENGKLYLKTPNFDDILHELIPEDFDTFNYRTAHLFYFCKKSLSYALKRSGFENFKITYIHDYDISNLLFWMKEKRPTGLNKTDIFDKGFNLIYTNYLEQTGKASHLWVEATK